MLEDNPTDVTESWMVQIDGSSAKDKGRVRVIITSPKGDALKYRF